jgi:hypothetical protein
VNYIVSLKKDAKSIEFYKDKELEIINDCFSSMIVKIKNIVLKENLFITFENKSNIEFENLINAYDFNTNCMIKLIKLNIDNRNNENTFFIKDINTNSCFNRSSARKEISEISINLIYKDIYNQKKELFTKGNDISEGGISFFINSDEVNIIKEYLSVSSQDLNLKQQKIQIKNMKIFDSKFLVGTKFI